MAEHEEGTYPLALKRGDTVAIVAPSMRLNNAFREAIARAKTFLESQSFKVMEIFTETLPTKHFDAVKVRVEELHRAFADTSVKAIVCAIGGSNSNELIRHLNYDLIKANPKIFCGYSDITVLHSAIYTKTGLRTFYGPAALSELADYPAPLQLTREDFIYVLSKSAGRALGIVPKSKQYAPKLPAFFSGGGFKTERKTVPNQGWRWLRSGKARGRLFGGCLASLVHLPGTEFWPDFDGRILLLETSMGEDSTKGPNIVIIRSQLADLGNSGVFEKTTGLVMGRPYGMDENAKVDFEKAVLDEIDVWARGRDYPVLTDIDVGHTGPILTIPLNALAELEKASDSASGRFEIMEAGTI